VDSSGHYGGVVQKEARTRFASCGYRDRFDPFVLNKNPRLRRLYGGMFDAFLGAAPCDRLLDIGCGTGIYFDALAPHARAIDALDLSEDMIRVAADYCRDAGLGHIRPRAASADRLPFADGAFDAAIAMDLLHHVPDPDRVLDEVRRVLKPDGRFFVFEPNILNPLTFLAQAIPREERLALGRNRPATLRRLLERRFETLRWQGLSAMVTQCGGFRGWIFDAYLKAWEWTRLQKLYTRQAWLGRPRRAA
jgi:SAM-dependent methyltransferase